MTRLERIQMRHNEFCEVQAELREWGADDTEPSWVYQDCVRRAVNGKPYITADGTDNPWQLYSSMKGYKTANKKLTTACGRVVRAITGALIKDMPLIREWVKANMRRVDIDFCP